MAEMKKINNSIASWFCLVNINRDGFIICDYFSVKTKNQLYKKRRVLFSLFLKKNLRKIYRKSRRYDYLLENVIEIMRFY